MKMTLKTLRVLTLMMMAAVTSSRASEYVPRSVLADGRWTKISTDTAGIYEIGYDRLIQWGYPSPEKVKIFGVGPVSMNDDKFPAGRIADDLPPTYSINDPERKKIFFYSPGTVSLNLTEISTIGTKSSRTPYTSRAAFLLTDKETPAYEPGKTGVDYSGQPLADTHYCLRFVEYELRNPADGGATMIGPDISIESPFELTFDYTGHGGGSTDWSTSLLHLNFVGADFRSQTRAKVTPDPVKLAADKIKTYHNSVPFINDEAIVFRPGSVDLTWEEPLDGKVSFTITPYEGFNPRFLAFDNAWTAYPRLSAMSASDASLDMYFPRTTPRSFFSLTFSSDEVRVLDVTDPANILEHQLTVTDRLAIGSLPANRSGGNHLIAFNPDLPQRAVSFEGPVANTNLHEAPVPEMLIITIPSLYDAACELAAIHSATDGLDCLVALDEDLYNEFGMGNRDAMAYRRAAKMFYDRDPERFRYVLLYGHGHWDNRGLLDGHGGEMLLTYQTKDPIAAGHKTRNFNADAFFGMVSEPKSATDDITSLSMDVAVGRIPVSDQVTARSVNDKIKRYLDQPWPASLYSKVLVMSDDGNQNIHFTQAETTIDILRQAGRPFTAVRAHNLLYDWNGSDAKIARDLIIGTLKAGVGLMTYTGHGSPGSFTSEMMWSRTAILATDHDVTPFAFLSTCDALDFDRDGVGIGETMLFKANGGVAGVIGASRTVYSPYNFDLSKNLTAEYAKATPGTTIGEIWKEGRNQTISTRLASSGLKYNTMCYNLGGDPSLPVRVPDYEITIDSIDGHQPIETTMLSSRRPIRLSGHINNDSFSGTLTISVYDTPVPVLTKPRNPASDAVVSTVLDHYVLMSKNIEVRDGRFSTSIVLPDPGTENDTLCSVMVLSADHLNGLSRASGQLGDIRIVARPESQSESFSAPVISSIAIDREATGGHILTADGVAGGADINVSATSVGMAPFVILDPETASETRLAISDGDIVRDGEFWTLTRRLPALSPGRHTLRLNLADNVGNRARAEHVFFVGPSATVKLEADTGRPALTETASPTFILSGEIATSRLIVRDLRGRNCLTVDNPSFPYTLAQPATPLPTGLYEVCVSGTLSDGTPFASSVVTIAVVAPVTQ